MVGEIHTWMKKLGIVPSARLTETSNGDRIIYSIDLCYTDGFARKLYKSCGASYDSPESAYQLALQDLGTQVLKDLRGGLNGESK